MITTLFCELILAIAGISALWLNFSTADAPTNYRNALFVMFVAHVGVAACLARGLTGELLVILPSVSLIYAIVVTVYNRIRLLPTEERLAMFTTRKFWATASISLLAIIVLIVVQLHR